MNSSLSSQTWPQANSSLVMEDGNSSLWGLDYCLPPTTVVSSNSSSSSSGGGGPDWWLVGMKYWAEGVTVLAICLAGIIGNLASILVLSRKDIDLKPSFANILTCMAVYDLLFEVCAILMYSLPQLSPEYMSSVFPLIVPYLLGTIHVAMMGSIYTTIAVALERCVTVCAPFADLKLFRGWVYILPIILFSLLYNVPKFGEVRPCKSAEGILSIEKTEMRKGVSYSVLYVGVANCLVTGLVPLLLLSLLNTVIYLVVARRPRVKGGSSHRRDSTMAALLTTIVLAFVVTNSLRAGLNIYEAYMKWVAGGKEVEWTLTLKVLTFVSNLLVVTNSSVNIVIYALKDFKFRQILGYIFCGQPLKPSRGPGNEQQSHARGATVRRSSFCMPLEGVTMEASMFLETHQPTDREHRGAQHNTSTESSPLDSFVISPSEQCPAVREEQGILMTDF